MATADENMVFLTKWNEVKALVAELDVDATKSAGGVKAAGSRFRKGTRELRKALQEIGKLSLELSKQKAE